jgi:hypothetical protein
MYTTYAGNYSLEYYNSAVELQSKIKALLRLFRLKRLGRNRRGLAFS